MSRVQRTTLTYAANLAITALTIIVGFVLTPALLRALGNERFGATRAAQDWQGHLTILDAALFAGLLPLLAQAYAVGDAERLRRIFATGMRAYLKLAAGMLAFGLLLVVAIPWLVPVHPDLIWDLRSGSAIGLFSILFVPLGLFRAMIDARQRGYLLHVLAGTQAIATSVLAVAFAWLDWGIAGQFAAALVGQALVGLMLAIEAWRNARDVLRENTWAADPEVAGKLWNLNAHALIQQTCGRLSLTIDGIIIAAALGPAIVVPFLLSQRLTGFAGGQLIGMGNAAWAALAELYSRGDLPRFNERLIELTRIITFAAVATLVPIAVHNQTFMTLWVGADQFAGLEVTVLSAVNAFLVGLASLWGWSVGGTGNGPRLSRLLIAGTTVNVVASIAGTLWLGMPGPLYGTLAAYIFYGAAYPWLLRQLFGTSPLGLGGAVLRPMLAGAPFAALVTYAGRQWPPMGWLGLAIHLGLSAALFLGLAFWVVFPAEERSEWLARGRRMLRIQR